MTERFGTLKSYIEAPKWAGVKEFLYDLSFKFNCELTILEHDKRVLSEFIAFKFSGYETKLKALHRAFKEAMEEYNRDPFVSDKYSVKEAVFEEVMDNLLKVDVRANKWSGVKKMIQSAAEYYNLPINIVEKSSGLLEKKVSASIMSSDKKKLNKVKDLLENHLETDNIVYVETSAEKLFKFKR